MRKAVHIILQVIFLVLFIILVITGKVQIWMGIFGVGVIVSIFFSRLYCGWVCPINTLTRSVSWVKRKLSIRGFKIPKFLKKTWVRYFALGLFAALFVFAMATGKKLPVLPAAIIIGVVLTLFFPEELWHRYLCPYGVIFSLVSKKSLYLVRINEDACTNCGVCQRVCPAGAIAKDSGSYKIKKEACLVCLDCSEKCKQKAIDYTINRKRK
jgi:ferredoxin-type protein NapH